MDQAIDPLHLAVSHWKSGSSNTDEYRRAIESRRMTQVADRFVSQGEPFVVMGDINADIGDGPQTPAMFTSIPTGLPTSFVTGADIKSLLFGNGLPNDPFGPLTALATLLDAIQLDGTDATRPSSGRRLDYLLVSPALATTSVQVYDCSDEHLPGGLPLHGSPLPASVCPTASDHLPVLADLVIPTLNLPTLQISDVTQAEGQSGTRAFAFTVRLSQKSTSTIQVRFATVAGTAVVGSDFGATSGTLTFTPGQTSKTVTVQVKGDTQQEANETFTVKLSNPNGATLADAVGRGTILNDDGPVLKLTDVTKAEGNSGTTAYTFTVTLSPASTGTVSVNYATANDTALAGSDYIARSGLLTFSPGQTSKQVTVSVRGDTTREANETFSVNLSAARGATLFDGQGLGTLLNDDGPVLKINSVAQPEGDAGLKRFNFVVSLSVPSTESVTVRYATANGQALAGSDYIARSGLLTFSPGQTSKTVGIDVKGDTVEEPNEYFQVKLSSPTGATLFTGRGIGTIRNDD